MWTPDIRTLFLILFLVNAFLTLMLFTFWKSQKTYYGFRTWMLSLLVISCGYFLFMLRGSISDLLSIIAASILILLSVMMRLDSTRRYFWSKPLPRIFYSILVPFAVLYLYYTYNIDSVLIRTLISNAIIAPTLLITALLALRLQEPESRSLRFGFASTLIVVAILLTVRIFFWLITPGNHSLFSTDPLNTIFFTVTIITDILSTGFFLMLNMARSRTELQASEDALFQANRKLNILSSITRHDIRNQLQALSGYLELSKDSLNNPANLSEFIAKEEKIANTILRQISFTKDYEDMGVNAPVWQNTDTIIRKAVAALPMRGVEIDIDRMDLEVFADPLLEKVFYNLIDNALKYGGNAMTKIRIFRHETGAGLILVWEDDGIGITREDKTRLFERGFGKHTGLGLFLSREILSITDITISETSEPGKGARFEILIPGGKYRFVSA
jgi:signal transduction histidine kinase